MQKYHHILLATDLHDECNKLAERALSIAEQHGAKLTMVHVVEPLPAYAMGYFGSVNIEKELLDEAEKNMEEYAKPLSVAKEDQKIEIGSVKVAILKAATDV